MMLDHVVLKVDDLEHAVEKYSKMGFTVFPGGEHENFGSHNALIAFSDGTYIELIAFRTPVPPQRRIEKSQELKRSGKTRIFSRVLPWGVVSEGLLDFALLPSDEEESFEKLKRRQLDIEGPMLMQRKRPDGKEISWEMAFPDHDDLPFLIRDITPRNLRLPSDCSHAIAVSGISRLFMVIRDLSSSQSRYETLLSTKARAYCDSQLPGGKSCAFPCGSTEIVLMEPDPANPDLKIFLEERGESVWWLELRTEANAARDGSVLEKLRELRISLN
ncbi:MAG: VOC family protein [SAR324 cluster bacterium]|nr:VOC family protein [SAR324 cluster bacterium]